MGKLRKYQLLEKAMRDYPAGTNYVSPFSGSKFTSKGIFILHMNGVAEVGGGELFDGEKWAETVKPSLLSGKCAIAVNNEREFKLLMEHYEGKGWKLDGDYIQFGFPQTAYYDSTNNGMSRGSQSSAATERLGYTVIPFADFAAEVGIEVPVFVMTSEDGVALYEGDKYFGINKFGSKWSYAKDFYVNEANAVYLKNAPEEAKGFSTKESAEKWIAEQSKPKSTTVYLYFGGAAEVYCDHVCLHGGLKVSPSDLEDMLKAYNSLQP